MYYYLTGQLVRKIPHLVGEAAQYQVEICLRRERTAASMAQAHQLQSKQKVRFDEALRKIGLIISRYPPDQRGHCGNCSRFKNLRGPQSNREGGANGGHTK